MEKSLGVSQKLKLELPYDPAIPLLVITPKGIESGNSNRYYTPLFITELFTIVKR